MISNRSNLYRPIFELMIVRASFMTVPMVLACTSLVRYGLIPDYAIMSVPKATRRMPSRIVYRRRMIGIR